MIYYAPENQAFVLKNAMSHHIGKILVLIAGDILILYLALFATLAIRYDGGFYRIFIESHGGPFTVIFLLWIAVFYIAGLYDLRRLRNNFDFLKSLGLTLVVNAGIAIGFFYLIPIVGIAPRRNLLLFLVIFAVAEFYWRQGFNKLTVTSEAPNKVLLIGNGETGNAIHETIRNNPQLGYEIVMWERAESLPALLGDLKTRVKRHRVNVIVVPRHFKKDERMSKIFYELLASGIEVRDLVNFYELIFRKVPIVELEEAWFLEHLTGHERFYDQLKHGGEMLTALVLGIVLLPLEILVAFLVKLTSRGPIVYRQIRVGRGGREFTLYKFRTMKSLAPDGSAETTGAVWSPSHDERSTVIGKFLRSTHIDELPQLINILKGELSFVGPRPERPEFTKHLREEIAYYDIRHIVRPGITGWAQINYHHDASVEDTIEKLQYDIYYLKNRSPILDVTIILKTLKHFFVNHKPQR